MNRTILRIALPSIFSNLTVPLLGLVDLALVGHLGDPAYIGAIAVGGLLFNILYWLFGFLRMGMSGLTAQAFGRRSLEGTFRSLAEAMGVACFVAMALIFLQQPLGTVAFFLIDATEEVEVAAACYYRILIWGAPAVLGGYVLTGWFLGMQNARFPMVVALVQNFVNVACSLGFVLGWGMQVEGVALGTLLAQWIGFLISAGMWFCCYGRHYKHYSLQLFQLFQPARLMPLFRLHRDIFFRTLCLVAVTTFFTSASARAGSLLLAASTLLMQLFTLFSYFMDGFAYAGEALAGRYIGAAAYLQLRRMIRCLFVWGWALALFFTLAYVWGGDCLLMLLSDDADVLHASADYLPWAWMVPLAGFAAFLWDGVLIGATSTRPMLYAMLIASVAYFSLYYIFASFLGLHALWLSFIVYLLLRSLCQTYAWHVMMKIWCTSEVV